MNNNTLIQTKNLHKSFFVKNYEIKALNGIDLSVTQGEILAVVGPSGSGKSTLLHIIGLMDKPTQGEIFFDRLSVSQLNEEERSKIRNSQIGFVFQFHYLLPEFTALENVFLPAIINSKNDRNVHQQAFELLKEMGLANRANHFPSELSGGEQQRVAVARALINQPRILLADEPTGNLDYETGKAIMELVVKFVKERKMSLVLVTHNTELIRLVPTDRTLSLFNGKIAT
ncbi:MAG: ABC transporter ATP-binding protein [Elusimicrobiota bacterium]|nr:ABC transporter ATP-binding protein [Elusimicrobiota bacterium]